MTQVIFPRALFALDHRRSISLTTCFMFGRYLRAATSGVIEEEKDQILASEHRTPTLYWKHDSAYARF
jgi:hypothetical protein